MPSSYELCFKIGGLVFCVTSPDQTVKLKLDESALHFSCNAARPDVQITARRSDLSSVVIEGRKIFDPGLSWKLYEHEDSYLFAFYAPISGSVPYKVACMKRDFSSGEVLLHAPCFKPDEALFPLDYPLDELLFVNFLSQGRGAELHACGIKDAKGNGHLFIGQSGAGKSTIGRLLTEMAGCRILSDDRIAIRIKDGQPWIFGTPWHGEAEFSSPDSAPLRTILFLAKDSTNKLVPLPEATVVGRLLACSFPPFFDPGGLDYTLSFFDDVGHIVPSYELRFRPDNDVLGLVEQLSRDA
jgi:hypothetical protein